jgi:hypothetical protein
MNYGRDGKDQRESTFAQKSGIDNDLQTTYFQQRRRSKGLVQIKLANPK